MKTLGVKAFGVVFGDEDLLKTELIGFDNAGLDAGDGADFTGKSHLGGERLAVVDGDIGVGGQNSGHHRKVQGGVVAADAAGDVQEHVFHVQAEAGAFFEDGQQHVHPSGVEACAGALRRAVGGGAHQSLGLDEHGALSLHGGGDGDTAHFFVAL